MAKYKCDKCGKEFEKKANAEKHEKICKKNISLIRKIQNQIIENKNDITIILCIFGVIFLVFLISSSETAKEVLSSIFGLIFFGLMCYFCAGFCGRNKSQVQSQQVIVHSGEHKRVCSKCGMQNNVSSIYCNDCGHKLKKK